MGQLIGYFIKRDVSHVTAAFGKHGARPSVLETETRVLAAAEEYGKQCRGDSGQAPLFAEVAFGDFLERAKTTCHLELYRPWRGRGIASDGE